MNNLAIHHHFEFSRWILYNAWYSKKITFQNIPFFQLYPLRDLNNIRNLVDSISRSMPPQYRNLFNIFNPPDHIKNSNYRQEHISLTYCEFNNQSFFLRCYQLKQNDFIKVEITFFSESIWQWKYLYLDNTIKNAEKVFDYIWQYTFPVSLFKHWNDYFLIQSFEKYIRAFERDLLSLNSQTNNTLKNYLKRGFVKHLVEFKKNSKVIAEQRLKDIREEFKMTYLSEKDLL